MSEYWFEGKLRSVDEIASIATVRKNRIAELEANQRDATHNELHVRVTELLKQKRELEVQLKTCQVWIKEARRIIPLSLEQSIDAAHNRKVVSDE